MSCDKRSKHPETSGHTTDECIPGGLALGRVLPLGFRGPPGSRLPAGLAAGWSSAVMWCGRPAGALSRRRSEAGGGGGCAYSWAGPPCRSSGGGGGVPGSVFGGVPGPLAVLARFLAPPHIPFQGRPREALTLSQGGGLWCLGFWLGFRSKGGGGLLSEAAGGSTWGGRRALLGLLRSANSLFTLCLV